MTRFSLTKKIAASDYEYSYAKLEGMEFAYNKKPVEITDDGVIFRDLIEHADGSQEEIAGSDQLYPCDSVIISISQAPMNVIVNTTMGLEANKRGLLAADDVGRPAARGSLRPRCGAGCQNGCGGSRLLQACCEGDGSVYSEFAERRISKKNVPGDASFAYSRDICYGCESFCSFLIICAVVYSIISANLSTTSCPNISIISSMGSAVSSYAL